MVPSRSAGGLSHSPSSGIFVQEDGHPLAVGNSHLRSSFGNSSNSIPGSARSNLGPVSGEMNNAIFNSVTSSGPSAGASSLVTDANSGLSGGPPFQRSGSINTDSYMRLPASPISFSSNNISISGSSVKDGSSLVQRFSNQDPNAQQNQQPTSSVTSLPTPRKGQVSFPTGPRFKGSFVQEPNIMCQLQKKPRLDIKQEDILQHQVLQELLHRKDPLQLTNNNPQFQAFVQQQRLRQQQEELLQSMPPAQRAQLLQQQQQCRQLLQQQSVQPSSAMKRPNDGGVCSRRLMQYLYHQRQRPSDNPIAYWRKFVSEYFSPRAKKRWCLSLYENVGQHSLGVFPQATMDAWQCDLCGSKSGKGFEATFEMLPRLYEIKFGSGVIDELLFLDMPREYRFPTGVMILEYPKAVQESVYEQLRVVREGQLRVVFAPDLKILSWQLCSRRHEELLPRRLLAPQVNQLLQVAQKCQSTIAESGPDGVSQEDLQTNSNMIVTAGRQLARTLELPQLNDLGFSKRYVRCLQISEVVNSMKDLMDFCRERKVGPIEGLKSYPLHSTAANLQRQKMQEIEQLAGLQGLPTDRNTLNKLMALNTQMSSNNHHMIGRGALSGPTQSSVTVTNYQNMLSRQNSMSSNSNSFQHEASSSTFQGFSNSQFQQQQSNQQQQQQQQQQSNQLQQRSLNRSGLHLSQGSNVSQQQMVDQLLQGMSNNTAKDGRGFGSNGSAETSASPNGPGSVTCGAAPSRSNSSKSASDHESSAAGGNSGSHQKPPYLPQNLHLSDDMVRDIAHDLTENGFFNSDLEDNMGYEWKA